MTAPPTVSRPDASSPAPLRESDAAARASRVVSVSPRAVDVSAGSSSIAPSSRVRTASAFISPRVIDQNAFDELAATLRTLIDEAAEAGRRLTAQIAQVEGGQSGAKKAGVELQERLQLGAKMLSAFQSQIVRIEESLAELDRRDRLARAMPLPAAVADEALARFHAQLNETMRQAEAEIAERIDAVQAAADATNQRLAATLRSLAECIEAEASERITSPPELAPGAD